MAVQRLSLTNIIDLIRFYIAEPDADVSRLKNITDSSGTTATLLLIINGYGQQISTRLGALARQEGLDLKSGKVYPDFWRTSGSLTTSKSSSSATFPSDYSKWISFYDRTNKKVIHPVEEISRWRLDEYRNSPAGPTKAIEMLGVNSSSVITSTLWPSVEDEITPDIELIYWREPATMPGTSQSTEYPDAPPEFHMLWVYGAVLEIMRPDHPRFNRFQQKEQEMLTEMMRVSRAI